MSVLGSCSSFVFLHSFFNQRMGCHHLFILCTQPTQSDEWMSFTSIFQCCVEKGVKKIINIFSFFFRFLYVLKLFCIFMADGFPIHSVLNSKRERTREWALYWNQRISRSHSMACCQKGWEYFVLYTYLKCIFFALLCGRGKKMYVKSVVIFFLLHLSDPEIHISFERFWVTRW